MQKFDLIIIGGGRATSLGVTAGKLGKKVAIIEKSTLGGTCPNRGCVPSKLLIGYANVARAIQESKRHFIDATINTIDQQTIFDKTNHYISKIDEIYQNKFNENVEIFRGIGSFISDHVVEVNNQKLTAPRIVIATGTRPIKPPHEKAWSSDDIFPLKGKIPNSIAIVGSGFIAAELANLFDAIGIETKLLIRNENLLRNEDHDIARIFKEEFTKNVDVLFNTTIKETTYENNQFKLILQTNEKESNLECDALLYATGREANSDLLHLENTSIKLNKRGFIQRDEYFQTQAKGVYVVGDAAGEYMLQHAAAYEINHLGKMLFEGEKEPLKFKYMPHAVFSHPEIASVGITEQKAEESQLKYVVSTTNWQASAKAQSLRIKYPITKLIINPDNYEILGCHMIGPESSIMMHQVLAVMHIQNDIRHLKEMLYIHPALSEALLPAAVEAVKKVEHYNEVKN
ncbi:MAG: dihydrolipoyl dehydrogenase family protein [Candidatus Marinarcus sp.]|uniref:dihydrolipoyl dehydrogenase family protein n=1 Tax=Candidatus Marinarcus sp. TaxID=3100987 RepID=UPI003AFF8710